MAINCSSNALLDTLNAKKDALNAKVGELSSLGAAAMADLQAKADDMKDALLAAVPEPPVIPNFKKELEELRDKVGEDLARAKAAFKERWGDSLPDVDIDGMMENVSAMGSALGDLAGGVEDALSGIAGGVADAFDFCKDVPNVEAPEVSPEGKVEKIKVKAAEPTVAADIPKKVEEVEPTVIEKEKEPSVSPTVEVSAADLKEAKDQKSRELNEYRDTYKDLQTEATQSVLTILLKGARDDDATVSSAMDSTWQSIDSIAGRMISRAKLEGVSNIDYYNSGKRRKLDRRIFKQYIIARSEEAKFKEYNGQLLRLNRMIAYNSYMPNGLEGEAKEIEAYMNKKIVIVKEEGDALVETTPGGHDGVITGYVAVIEKHKQIMKDLYAYKA